LRELAKIIAYLVAVVLLGALLAPPLFWTGHALAESGTLHFLGEVTFQRYFTRAVLVAALVLLWPAVRSLRIGGWRDLGLEKDARWRAHLGAGVTIGTGLVALMALIYVPLGFYRWKKGDLPWDRLPSLALSAMVVALLEECLFRGGIFGLFRRTLRPFTALFWVTAIFAIVHFLKPDGDVIVQDVHWLSGFALLPQVFHPFAEPMRALAGFSTIFVLGWVLGYATLRTRSLWLAIGFHAGVVFVKMSFAKFTKREALSLPWIGPELQMGLVPVGVLALGGLLVWFWLRHENSPTRG
jgi:membrane protease YdiL (CAAX protease family)